MDHHIGTKGQGLLQQGERKVLSTTTWAPTPWEASAMAAMSTTRSSGLEGLHPHQCGFLGQRGGQRHLVSLIHELHLVVALGRQILEQAPGTAVAVVGGDQQIPALSRAVVTR